jgi:hypothetical protein
MITNHYGHGACDVTCPVSHVNFDQSILLSDTSLRRRDLQATFKMDGTWVRVSIKYLNMRPLVPETIIEIPKFNSIENWG